MKRRATVLALALLAGPAWAEPGFHPGEQIEFTIDYLGIRTGQARISVGKAEGRVWPVIAQARTDGLASIVDIREHLVSYWDAEAKLPRGSDLQAVEVGDRHTDSARFDREAGTAMVSITRKGSRDARTYPLQADAQDFASAVLWLRSQPLAEGERYEIPVFTTKGPFTLVATVTGREAVETPAGTFEALKVEVHTAFEGKFSARRDTLIWFSADEHRIPVRVSAEFAVGNIVATLSSYRPGGALARN
jgi:hypothetical protein